jgi:hypothetical protein
LSATKAQGAKLIKVQMLFFSPDCSENPFYFFFKNKKIATKSGTKLPVKTEYCAPEKNKSQANLRLLYESQNFGRY